MPFLSHKNWSGLGAIAAFIVIPLTLASLYVTLYPPGTPVRRLEIHETQRSYLGRFTGDHSYMIYFSLENTGNVPIKPADFADEPAIMTPPFHSIPVLLVTLTSCVIQADRL